MIGYSYKNLAKFNERYERAYVLQAKDEIAYVLP